MKLRYFSTAAMVVALASAMAQTPQPVPAGMIKKAPPPDFAIRVDGQGNVIERIDLNALRALRGATVQAPAWTVGWDSQYMDMSGYPVVNFFVNGIYGVPTASAQSYWYGPQAWYPYNNNDIVIPAAAHRKYATYMASSVVWNTNGNTTVGDLGAPTITALVGWFTAEDFDSDATEATGNDPKFGNGGYLFEWVNLPDGFWFLSVDAAESGIGVPLTTGAGSLSVQLAEYSSPTTIVPAGQFSSLLYCYTAISRMGAPTDVLAGTNPSDSGPLEWYDNDGDWTLDGGGSPVSGELASRVFGTLGEFQTQVSLMVDTNEIYVNGTATHEDVTPFNGQIDITAWDTAMNAPYANSTSSNFISLGAAGEFSVLHPRFDPDGTGPLPVVNTYKISMKPVHWLRKTSAVIDFTSGSVNGVNFTLLNGDVNNDNEIGPADFTILSGAFGTFLGDAGYVAGADLNEDEEVGPADFTILSRNFGEIGDDPVQ